MSLVYCDMPHLPSLPRLENIFYHILWISSVSFACHKLHTLSVGIRGLESSLTSLGNGRRHNQIFQLLGGNILDLYQDRTDVEWVWWKHLLSNYCEFVQNKELISTKVM